MRNPLARFGLLAALAATALSACGHPGYLTDGSVAPEVGDEGTLLAGAYMVPGISQAASVMGQKGDCTGPGLGVVVEGSTSSGKYLYDSNGEPCSTATLLFDGRTPVDSRAADPGIVMSFHDGLGPIPAPDGPLTPIPRIEVTDELISEAKPVPRSTVGAPQAAGQIAQDQTAPKRVVENAPPPKPDPLVAQLAAWNAVDKTMAARMVEADAAAARNISNIANDSKAQQERDMVGQLAAKLRERERQIQEEQRRQADTLARAGENRAQTEAAQLAWKQKEQELQSELNATQTRLSQFEKLAGELKADKSAKENSYQNKIKDLSINLKAAEAQADASRRELVLQAAAKIAEAEQLAYAAQQQEQQAKLRESERLRTEASVMMDRALAIQAGKSVRDVIADTSPEAAAPLEAVPVTIHAKNQTLEELVKNVLTQASPKAGVWETDWQLSGKAQYILKEKWSLTAEAPVQQVLAQLASQVKEAHGFTLSFTQFEQSRLLVVTDTPPEAKKAGTAE